MTSLNLPAAPAPPSPPKLPPWKVLIVDDADEVRTMTRLALEGFTYQGRSLSLLEASSADEAKDLFETAVFEENQNNIPHARELYEELIRAHPSSKLAELAKARLADLKDR